MKIIFKDYHSGKILAGDKDYGEIDSDYIPKVSDVIEIDDNPYRVVKSTVSYYCKKFGEVHATIEVYELIERSI